MLIHFQLGYNKIICVAAVCLLRSGLRQNRFLTGDIVHIEVYPERSRIMEFKEVIRKRYSCKKYSERPVEREKLQAILEAGRTAPTAKNLQEQMIYVVESEENLAKIDAVTPCRYNAPTVLVVAFDKNNVFTYPGGKRDSGIEDAAIVATHLTLAAADEGVDSCWLNNFDPEKLKASLGLPDKMEILMLLDLGYAADGAGPLANHNSRKELSETVKYI